MESSYYQQTVTFFWGGGGGGGVFNLQLAWPPHFLACSTAPEITTLLRIKKRELTLWYGIILLREEMHRH